MSIDTTQALMGRDDVLTVRWDRIVTREDGTVWAFCLADDGRPVALALDEEHAEALAGSLLDTPDGEEVAPSADDVRDRIAIMLYSPPDPYTAPGWARAQDVARHQADAVMDVVAPALAAKDAKIAELEAEIDRADLRADRRAADLRARNARVRELEERLAGSVTSRPEAAGGQACIGGTRIPARIIAGLVPDVGEDGVADYYPAVTPADARAAVRFAELYVDREEADRLQALAKVRGKWAAHRRKRIRALVAENQDLRAQLAATTRPHRATDRLADDARPAPRSTT